MRKIIFLILCCVILSGCATTPSGYQRHVSIISNAEREYFNDPEGKLLFKITSIANISAPKANITIENNEFDINDSSKETNIFYLPFVYPFDLKKMKETINRRASEIDALQTEMVENNMQWPSIYVFAQSEKLYAGLKGEVYWEGKLVQSDKDATGFASILLKYEFSVHDFIKK